MPQTDAYGNVLTTESPKARDAYDKGVALFLGSNAGARDAFADAVAQDPGFALGHVALARALMMVSQMPEAKAALAKADPARVTKREAAHIHIFSLLLSGKPVETRNAVREHVIQYPRDVLAAQLCTNVFGLIGFSGQVGREAELLAYTTALLPHYGDDWWMQSMHALSLCETGQTDASLALMETSLAKNPANANGSHFKAHALYEAGETAIGRAYLKDWMPKYDPVGLLHGHLSWHQALWALHAGDEAEMWEILDAQVGPDGSKGMPINVLTDSAALLFRAEMAGFKVEAERWATLSDYATRFFPNPGQSFADIHAALSHAMAGNGEKLALIAETTKGFAGDLVRPVARVWSAIARENWTQALEDLTPVMAVTERVGGSRAQRDLLELTYTNVLMKLGRPEEARRYLAMRRPVLVENAPISGWASA